MVELNECWIVDYARTAFSRSRPKSPERDVFGDKRPDELLALLLMKYFDGKLADKGITKEDIQEVSIGSAMGVYEAWTYGGRIPLFLAEFPMKTSAFFVDKQCGSAGAGLAQVALEIMTGYTDVGLATGVEHMTRIPMQNDWVNANLNMINKKSEWYRPQYDMLTTINMLQTAQKLYEQETPHFTKEDLDKFGVRSHNLTIQSQEEGWFTSGINGGEIIPIEGHAEGNVEEKMMIDKDMAARKSSLEKVATLPRLSKPFYLEKNAYGEDIGGKEGYKEREGTTKGVITPGNASPLNAGATAAVLMSAKTAEKKGIEPLAKVISMGWAGVDPSVMGRGPVPASKMALEKVGMTADEIDYWEINEAFCIVALNCMRQLDIPEEKVNVMGGSTAIGHPLGSTMVRLTGTLARILKHKGGKYGIANACIGGGQGIAILIENPDA
ncbi:MAG: acetyl-CoA C-acyltransferase [Candidatus Lokiarchaeota archaeon]|nr:acetyl-CoA C-acyltransferase [Candidatus Lokiarchaeota archaeon]MBD3199660.1 acetyl-CoA C-acyltransferase [Candidatus Lokiarchaeota archaeon]